MKFSCKCLFNIVSGHPAMTENVSKKKLESHKRFFETSCNKKMGLIRNRPLSSASYGLQLVALIQPSIAHHSELRNGMER